MRLNKVKFGNFNLKEGKCCILAAAKETLYCLVLTEYTKLLKNKALPDKQSMLLLLLHCCFTSTVNI